MNRGWKRVIVDVTDASLARDEARRVGVELTVLQECSPGGGNPEVKLYGPKGSVEQLLLSWGYNEHGESVPDEMWTCPDCHEEMLAWQQPDHRATKHDPRRI